MLDKPTNKYKFCNHHHEIGEDHEIVNFGSGGFVSILLDENVFIEIKTVNEKDAERTEYNGKKELLIHWSKNK